MNDDHGVLVDSDAFVAIMLEKDANHGKAKEIFGYLAEDNDSLITTNWTCSYEMLHIWEAELRHPQAEILQYS